MAVADAGVGAAGRPSPGSMDVLVKGSSSARFGSSICEVYDVCPSNVAA
jgi:hypothetical protein